MTAENKPQFEIRQCSQDSCRFRFPHLWGNDDGDQCPRCGAPTQPAAGPFTSRSHTPDRAGSAAPVVEGFLDNIRSGYNVGSLFRTADGVGLRHLHLGGITPTPFHSKVRKTALGAETAVPWSHHRNGLDAIKDLKDQGYGIWALENDSMARSLFETSAGESYDRPLLLIAGNELSGVDPGILALCDRIVALPMLGKKQSLNVVVAFGVAAYTLRFGFQEIAL